MTPDLLPPSGRAIMPDLVRAFALIGIAVVNVVGFAQPASTGFYGDGLATEADRWAFGAMATLFLMKAYPLFSMMFGAGLAWQLASASRTGADASARYYRRMAALFGLGLLHFIFFWYGDILMTYAILGCLLFTLRNTSPKALIWSGIGFIALNTFILLLFAGIMYAGETYAPEAMSEAMGANFEESQVVAFTEGSFFTAALWRLGQLELVLPSVLMQQGIAVFGYFCFGLAAVRMGAIDAPKAAIWKMSRLYFLPVGLVGSALGAVVLLDAPSPVSSQFLLGTTILMAFSPFSALGYAGLIALFSKGRAGPVRQFLARAGSASLTAYLLQSLVLSLIFAGYGFGQFGQMSASEAILTGLTVAVGSLLFTGLWRSFAARGPMEVLLRRVTYWGRA